MSRTVYSIGEAIRFHDRRIQRMAYTGSLIEFSQKMKRLYPAIEARLAQSEAEGVRD